MAHSTTYIDGRDLERDCEAFMRFRLTYEGPLLSSKPLKDCERDKRAAHKHTIRRVFHSQLKEFWRTNTFLSSHMMDSASKPLLPTEAQDAHWGSEAEKRPMADVLGDIYGHHDYKYVPLVRKEISLACSLRILCLRRDSHDAVLPGRDIDNRIKTVIDALTMVQHKQGQPIGEDLKPLPPGPGEVPFFVLLDDDRQVTHLEVETDTALEPDPKNPSDESFVRLVIAVEIRPYNNVNMFNLSFA